jgi:hypothetical protein
MLMLPTFPFDPRRAGAATVRHHVAHLYRIPVALSW